MIIYDSTANGIPQAIKDTNLYKQLDARSERIVIYDGMLDGKAGTTYHLTKDLQYVAIDPNNQNNIFDLYDTYIHELNHALNNLKNPNRHDSLSSELLEAFDTGYLLPELIKENFGAGGIKNGQCIQ